MRNTNGFISLHRSVFEGDIASNHILFFIWNWLLSFANYQDRKSMVNGKQIVIKRGQIWTSLREISGNVNVSINTAKKYLDYLEKTERITIQKTSTGSVITIVNYDKYQSKNTDGVSMIHTRRINQ